MSVSNSRLGRVLIVKLDREDKRNALNKQVTPGLDAALNELEDDPELWCGVLTGGDRYLLGRRLPQRMTG